jgi:hypothetical protein
MRFANCDEFELSPESGSEVNFNDYSKQLETLQKEQNIKVHITPEEIVDALKVALRQNCKHYFLTSQLFEEVRSIGNGHGWCGTIPPFRYRLEFVKDVNLVRVSSVKKECVPKVDVLERSMQRITGRLECDYKSAIEVVNGSEMSSSKRYSFTTIVNICFYLV